MTATSEVLYGSKQPELTKPGFEADATVIVFPTNYNPNASTGDKIQADQPESTIRYNPSASLSTQVAAHIAVRQVLELGLSGRLITWQAQNLNITDRRSGMGPLGLKSQVLVTAIIGSSLPGNEGITSERSFVFDHLGGPELLTEEMRISIGKIAAARDAAEYASHRPMFDLLGNPIEKPDYRTHRVLNF